MSRVGHWHCHIFFTLGDAPGVSGSGTFNPGSQRPTSINGDDVIEVFKQQIEAASVEI
jgi:hypothetical protein